MSWSDRRSILLTLALAGCGFAPVYGPGGSAEGLHGKVAIDAPRDAEGFAFVQALRRRLGEGDAARYRLSADLTLDEKQLGVTRGQVITRYQVVGQARYRLTDAATDARVASGTVESFASYSATGTTFATRTARRDARERLMTILADQVVDRLLATAADWR